MKWITLGLLLTFLGLQYQIWVHNGGLANQYQHTYQEAQQSQEINDQSALRNKRLKAQIKDLQDGYDSVSEIARSQLGYIQEGEVFYRSEE